MARRPPASHGASVHSGMADIYETIWAHPTSHLSVSRRNAQGEWEDPGADVLLDEQGKAHGCTSADAVRPLFGGMNEARLHEPTFATFVELLGDFTARVGLPERTLDDPVHAAKVDAFLDAVFATEPMGLAVDHVRREVEPAITDADLRDRVRRMWFEPYTNRFSGEDPFCVGFEHVFVGEDETGPAGAGTCDDAVGGYHSWVKYYLDQRAGRAAYLGNDYSQSLADQGVADPGEASVIMTWRPPVADGDAGYELLKRPGGFFVGTRPECDIALGTVALLEVLAGRFQNGSQENHRRVRFGDSFVDLVLHPQTLSVQPRSNGPRIRTFYPKYRGDQAPGDGDGGGGPAGGGGSVPTQPHNDGPVRIVRAQPNPPGPGDEGEWVELRNATAENIDLAGWRLEDQSGRPCPLGGLLAPGDTSRVDVRTSDPAGMQLRNAGGWVLLFEDGQRRAAVRYDRAPEGGIVDF